MNVTKLVSSIEYAYATDVSVIRVSPTKVKVSEHTNWTKICTKPFPNLIISDKMEAKNKLWTAELDFFTNQSLPTHRRLVWKIGFSNGQFMLLGNGQRPYPIQQFTDKAPENPTDNQLLEVKVTYSTPRIIPCII